MRPRLVCIVGVRLQCSVRFSAAVLTVICHVAVGRLIDDDVSPVWPKTGMSLTGVIIQIRSI